ncbi:MAG: ABC transporter ATP-binding protein [Oscillospiraceae bacterium]
MRLISLQNVKKAYGKKQKVQALADLSLEIEQGEMVSVMGKSGSGKSTMLNIISGIDRYDSGEYFFESQDMRLIKGDSITEFRRKNMGFIVQHFALIDDYTVYDNIALLLRYEKCPKKEIEKKVLEVSESLEIGDQLKKYPRELSGGQAQRAAIARAIINHPKILLADEPTGALDENTGDSIMKLLLDLNSKGTTVVIVTHDEKVASMCQRTILIKDGKNR